MVATLTRVFGVHNLALAEDVVQDAFCRALEVWKYRGMPENPSAWLMATAKNRALDVLRRQRTAQTFAPELGRLLDSEWTLAPSVAELFGAHTIKDDLLRMMFSCCHPRLAEEVQVALIINILCGFSIVEIASAFVSSHAAIEKRITRGKKILAGSKHLFDIAAPAGHRDLIGGSLVEVDQPFITCHPARLAFSGIVGADTIDYGLGGLAFGDIGCLFLGKAEMLLSDGERFEVVSMR